MPMKMVSRVHGLPGLGRIFGATQANHKCLGLTTRTLATLRL